MRRDPRAEEKVGIRAKSMLESALKSELSRFKTNNTQEKGRKDLKDLSIKLGIKEWNGSLGDKMTDLKSLKLDMSRHGFVHHYGVNGVTESHGIRKRHEVQRETPEFTTYWRDSHNYNLKSTDFISSAIDKSGVVPYLLSEITKIRGEQVVIGMSDYLNEATKKYVK